jgi:hypothetical protein
MERGAPSIIRQLIEDWVVCRDVRQWAQFRKVWRTDGQMIATWFQGSFEEFIRMNDEGFARGVRILHMLGDLRSSWVMIGQSARLR